MSRVRAILRRSTKPPFDFFQRWFSRLVWAKWLLGFLFWELSGDLPYTPWRTLSETAWDVELEYPGTQKELQDFLLGLAVHIRYRTTLESSIEWAKENAADFDRFVANSIPPDPSIGRGALGKGT